MPSEECVEWGGDRTLNRMVFVCPDDNDLAILHMKKADRSKQPADSKERFDPGAVPGTTG